jgi:hypothetical protein
MKQIKQLKAAQAGILALIFGITLIACNGKAQAGGGGDAAADLKQAADTAQSAAKDVADKAASAVRGAVGTGKPAEASDFIYSLNTARNGVVITGIQQDAKFGAHLVVPAEIEGFPVVAYLVRSNSSDNHGHRDSEAKKRNQPPLESVVFPDSITYLGKTGDDDLDKRYGLENEDYGSFSGKFRYDACSFAECNSLKSIVFPKNLKIVPILRGLPNLEPEGITWPEALEVMGGFGNDSTTELIIPNGVKIILHRAFSSMKKLTTVTIPDSVEEIRTYSASSGAFQGCPELTTVNLPAHPIKYNRGDDSEAFMDCPKLGIAAQKAIKDSGYTGRFRW